MIEKKINIDIVYPSTECAREFKSSLVRCHVLFLYFIIAASEYN